MFACTSNSLEITLEFGSNTLLGCAATTQACQGSRGLAKSSQHGILVSFGFQKLIFECVSEQAIRQGYLNHAVFNEAEILNLIVHYGGGLLKVRFSFKRHRFNISEVIDRASVPQRLRVYRAPG